MMMRFNSGSGQGRQLSLVACLFALVLQTLPAASVECYSKPGPPAPPVMFEHFPSRLHAYVWRNWELVDTPLLAETIGATPAQIEQIAASMGLGVNRAPSRAMQRQIYITIVKRNWHLLPVEQLLKLTGFGMEEFNFRLKEEDGLNYKLGSAKPACEPLRYCEPDADTQARAVAIKAELESHFGGSLNESGEMPLAFADAFNQAVPEAKPVASSDKLRIIYSYFGGYGDPLIEKPALDPYPDGLLAKFAAMGVNGVWMQAVLRNLAPGGPDFPEFGVDHEKRLASLRELVAKAGRHGIKVYLYLNEPRNMETSFFKNRPEMAGVHGFLGEDVTAMCTSDARVLRWMSDALAYVFKQVPDLGGVFTISASENLTSCASRGQEKLCPRCKNRTPRDIIVEVNKTIEEGVHRGNPNANVVVWDWGWEKHGEASDYIRQLPKKTWFLSVSEWAQPFQHGPVKSKVGEYSMSVVGPGPRATKHWAVAREQGIKAAAKVQLNNTWELSSLPYLPVTDLVAEHCANLAKQQVDGLLLSWTLGGYPSPNLKIAQWLIDGTYADADKALDALAVERYGRAAAPLVRRAWTRFSNGFKEFPYGLGLYAGPQQVGPANLLYATPTGYRATMTSYPFDDLKAWRGLYPEEALLDQFEKVAQGWEQGLEPMRDAVAKAEGVQRQAASEDLGIAEAGYCYFASVAQQIRFIRAREALAKNAQDAAARAALQKALDQEIALAKRFYPLVRRDSRIGFEAANHYYFRPLDLAEKVVSCEYLRQYFARK